MGRKQTEARIAELVDILRQRSLSKTKEECYKTELITNIYKLMEQSSSSSRNWYLKDLVIRESEDEKKKGIHYISVAEGASINFFRLFKDALKKTFDNDEDGTMFLRNFYTLCHTRKANLIDCRKDENDGIDHRLQENALKLYFNEMCKKCGKIVGVPKNVWSDASIERFFVEKDFTEEAIVQAKKDIAKIRGQKSDRLGQPTEDDEGAENSQQNDSIEYEYQNFIGKNNSTIEQALDKLDLVRQTISHDKNKNEVMKYIRYFVTMKLVKSGFFDTGGAQMTNVLWDDYVSKELIEYWKEHTDFRKNDAEIVAGFLNLKPDTVRKKLKKAEKYLASVDQESR